MEKKITTGMRVRVNAPLAPILDGREGTVLDNHGLTILGHQIFVRLDGDHSPSGPYDPDELEVL